jgi:hypothetical protein
LGFCLSPGCTEVCGEGHNCSPLVQVR